MKAFDAHDLAGKWNGGRVRRPELKSAMRSRIVVVGVELGEDVQKMALADDEEGRGIHAGWF